MSNQSDFERIFWKYASTIAIVVGIIWLLAIVTTPNARADDSVAPAKPDESAVMQYCLIDAARMAWGATARFAGAPLIFKYVGTPALLKIFEAPGIADLPKDGIYVSGDELVTATDKKEYEEAALAGWKEANTWVARGAPYPGYEMLMAIFYNGCKDALLPKARSIP